MANFRIDSIEFVYDSSADKYSLTGWCNLDAPNSANPVPGLQSGMDLNFNVVGDISNKKFSFSASAIDFSIFPDNTYELLKLNFSDSAVPSTKKGGIVIKNTNYPPPSKGHGILPTPFEIFIKKFAVTYVKFERIGLSALFKITIKIKPNNSQEKYSLDMVDIQEYITYTHTNLSDILILKAKEWPKDSENGVDLLQYLPINLPASIDSAHFPNGFPITLQKAGYSWMPEIIKKIMCVSIE